MQKPLTRYQRATLHQLEMWVNGISQHNPETNECTPDFSCCVPELFNPDPESRRAQLYGFHQRVGLIQ